jgi:hypothetical protein
MLGKVKTKMEREIDINNFSSISWFLKFLPKRRTKQYPVRRRIQGGIKLIKISAGIMIQTLEESI